MIWKYTLLLVGLLALSTIAQAQSRRGMDDSEPPGSLIDIDTELGKDKEEVPEESGSGKDSDDEDDDDDDLDKSSGSGSGAYNTDVEEDKPTTTTKTLTPCQNLHERSKHLIGNFVPKCDENGDYAPMQCRGHSSTGRCWCADRNGAVIPGTAVQAPAQLDCETGKNLQPCVFKLVKHMRNAMFGSYLPRCKIDGGFEEKQCFGSICFCVDEDGEKLYGTEKPIQESHNMCQSRTTEPAIIIPEKGITIKAEKPGKDVKPLPTKPEDPGYTIASKTPNVNVEPPKSDEEDDDEDQEADTESPNATGNKQDEIEEEKLQSAHIMTQPGLLAAIIGGAVVGLLCAILLVMFIVYRMRKKDEGSYALDEPRKKSTYSPINQSDKEYYA